MARKTCSVPSCSNTVPDLAHECEEHFGFTTIGPGTVKPSTSDLPGSLSPEVLTRLEESIMRHAGGDPELAARRAENGDATVRLLDEGEKIRKPACTVEVGGRHFEITNHHGRRAASRFFVTARRSLEADLPDDGWSENPVRPPVPTLAERESAWKQEHDQLENLLVGLGLGTHEEFTKVRADYEPMGYAELEKSIVDLIGEIAEHDGKNESSR